jgi:hypothetical protein
MGWVTLGSNCHLGSFPLEFGFEYLPGWVLERDSRNFTKFDFFAWVDGFCRI